MVFHFKEVKIATTIWGSEAWQTVVGVENQEVLKSQERRFSHQHQFGAPVLLDGQCEHICNTANRNTFCSKINDNYIDLRNIHQPSL